jgi:hypothetical protein
MGRNFTITTTCPCGGCGAYCSHAMRNPTLPRIKAASIKGMTSQPEHNKDEPQVQRQSKALPGLTVMAFLFFAIAVMAAVSAVTYYK